jgi:hypothetical protein
VQWFILIQQVTVRQQQWSGTGTTCNELDWFSRYLWDNNNGQEPEPRAMVRLDSAGICETTTMVKNRNHMLWFGSIQQVTVRQQQWSGTGTTCYVMVRLDLAGNCETTIMVRNRNHVQWFSLIQQETVKQHKDQEPCAMVRLGAAGNCETITLTFRYRNHMQRSSLIQQVTMKQKHWTGTGPLVQIRWLLVNPIQVGSDTITACLLWNLFFL